MTFSIKQKLLSTIGILAVFFCVSCTIWGLLPATNSFRQSKTLAMANSISDHILSASALLALERGLTTTALSLRANGKQVPVRLSDKIKFARQDAVKQMQEVIDGVESLIQKSEIDSAYRELSSQLLAQRAVVNKARSHADAIISGSMIDNMNSPDWVVAMTDYIRMGARLRLAAFSPKQPRELVYQINRSVNQSIWKISEYAGLERAMLGRATASRVRLTGDELDNLSRYRIIVEENLKSLDYQVGVLLESNGDESKQVKGDVRKALENVKSTFAGNYQQAREKIYSAQWSGEYAIGPTEWLEVSTAAVESVLDLNRYASKLAFANVDLMQEDSDNQLYSAAVLSVIGIALALLGLISVVRITRRIDNIQNELVRGVNTKDLTTRMDARKRDELGNMCTAYNELSQQIEELILQSMEAGITVSDAASSMGLVARQTQQSITVQRAGTTEVTHNIDEMIDSIKDVADNSHHGSETANNARQHALSGLDVTQDCISSINALAVDIQLAEKVVYRLEAENQEIGGIVAAIHGIADQTNLLALNAAIEAARAGESGRGFAVVADEVRNLAKRTQESTHQIENIIGRLKNSTDEAVVAMKRSNEKVSDSVSKADETGKVFNSIAESVNAINEINAQIAKATDEQVSVFSGLSQNMRANIQQFEQLTSDSAGKTQRSGVHLGNAVEELQELVGKYIFDGREHFMLNHGKHSHLDWKGRIRDYLDGASTLTPEQVCSHHQCDFGQWYHSAEAQQFMDDPAMVAIEKPHEELHDTISEIVKLNGQDRKAEAEALYGEVVRLSEEMVGHIEEAERHLGVDRKSILTQRNVTAQELDDVLF